MNKLFTITRLLLFPLSVIYYIIITLRNLFYDFGIIKSIEYKTPIISVGNLTVGGTGKTPFVIYLAEYFIRKNKKVGVISRGYKSKAKELVIAYDSKGNKAPVDLTGDELGMIINRFSSSDNNFFAIAYYNRSEAIKKMEELFSPDIIILDDAFQNRSINKTIDIIIINKEWNTLFNKILLPAGNLREPYSSSERADIVLNNFKFLPIKDNHSFAFNYINNGYCDIHNNSLLHTDKIRAITISGIADNNSFINAVKSSGVNVIKSYSFCDHYDYLQSNIRNFESDYMEENIFITTEKDFVKLKEYNDFIEKYPVYYLRIDVNLDNNILEELFRKKDLQW